MEQYIIKYAMAIRLGLHVFQYAGPFPSIQHASTWDMKLRKDAAKVGMTIPEATCEPIYSDVGSEKEPS